MKKKKLTWSLLIIIMVTAMSIGLSSCSNDDKEEASTNLSGTVWGGYDYDGTYNTIRFTGPYTGMWIETETGNDTETITFEYSMPNATNGVITSDEDSNDKVFFKINGKKMTLMEDDGDVFGILDKK